MPTSKKSANKKGDSPPTKKVKKLPTKDDEHLSEVTIDPQQEQIDNLIREREQIRSKLNLICSKIFDNINMENYSNEIDLTQQEPSDVSIDSIFNMIDEICDYRTAFLNLFQEIDDQEKISVEKKITQLAIESPSLFRKRLTSDQRLTFVVRERDLWKENAQLLQIMYATIVDQLEMGIYKKLNIKTNEILQAHRLNLEDVCLIFSSPLIRSIHDAQKLREILSIKKDSNQLEKERNISPTNSTTIPTNESENDNHIEVNERSIDSPAKNKRNVSFANQVNVIEDIVDHDEPPPPQQQQQQREPMMESPPMKVRLPSAHETVVDKMDSNLRMSIIKELSKDSQIVKPPSKMSSTYRPTPRDSNASYRTRKKLPEWVILARLIGIDESEIDHWLSQSLQFPAGRVISTWCNTTSPPPTVALLHTLVQSNELNRFDLARQIETMYNI